MYPWDFNSQRGLGGDKWKKVEESVPRVSQEEGPSPLGRAACGAPRGSGGRSSGVVGPESHNSVFFRKGKAGPSRQFRVE